MCKAWGARVGLPQASTRRLGAMEVEALQSTAGEALGEWRPPPSPGHGPRTSCCKPGGTRPAPPPSLRLDQDRKLFPGRVFGEGYLSVWGRRPPPRRALSTVTNCAAWQAGPGAPSTSREHRAGCQRLSSGRGGGGLGPACSPCDSRTVPPQQDCLTCHQSEKLLPLFPAGQPVLWTLAPAPVKRHQTGKKGRTQG